jgi:hypothetical protein
MIRSIDIGPVSENIETKMHLSFGENVSVERVINFVVRNASMKKKCGLISQMEAEAMVKDIVSKV